MKQRTKSLPLLVLVAVVALVLGSFGTAVAGPAITKSKVKKIATKIVNKAAPNLSVKNAQTATLAANATQLNGLPASAYQTTSTRFRLAPGAVSLNHTYTFTGLAPGTYHVTYTTLWTNDANVACWIQASAANTVHEALGYNTANAGNSANAASGIVTLTAAPPQLLCQNQAGAANTIYSALADYPSTVVFTRIDGSTNGIVIGSRSGGGARPTP